MTRTARLLDLLQTLRQHRAPVSGRQLASDMGISIRTLYRDIATLQAQGADIEGEPGLGYVLRPGFTLPPLMFSIEEIEALVVGSKLVAARTDSRLGAAGESALSKITAVLPSDLRHQVDNSGLYVRTGEAMVDKVDMGIIRHAIRNERKLQIAYRTIEGAESERTIWPLVIAFFEQARIVAAWCELRQDYRHFRVDRILDVAPTDMRYPRRRAAMVREWQEQAGIARAQK